MSLKIYFAFNENNNALIFALNYQDLTENATAVAKDRRIFFLERQTPFVVTTEFFNCI